MLYVILTYNSGVNILHGHWSEIYNIENALLFCSWTDFKYFLFCWKIGPRGWRDKIFTPDSWYYYHCNRQWHYCLKRLYLVSKYFLELLFLLSVCWSSENILQKCESYLSSKEIGSWAILDFFVILCQWEGGDIQVICIAIQKKIGLLFTTVPNVTTRQINACVSKKTFVLLTFHYSFLQRK